MIEKQIVAALEPFIDAIVAVEKKIDAIELKAGPQGEPGRDGKDADADSVAEIIKADQAFADRLKGERGDKGDPGRDADPAEIAKQMIGEVAELVRENVKESAWTPGIYREGKFVSHYTGRTYQALQDTTDEPGDSPHWKRIGSHGFRDVGGFSEDRAFEPGDFYHKDGATFFFDGVNHRLFQAKPITARELEKAIKGVRSGQAEAIASVIDRQKTLEARIDDLTTALSTYKAMIERLSADLDGMAGGR